MRQSDLVKVRKAVVDQIGRKVKFKANRGRHRYDIAEGVISETYPSIFLIKVFDEEEDSYKMISFSYSDVLTKDVQIMLCNN